ncbi:AraC-like DNA-binding protein/mannose-6-phosphate isomerase-like protein (cupin superfamily) [Variovorax sp. W1I1]|uniref:AraC family transcriptional regulator n=1 Tax=Variovorax sp. W1I1 TaxID=3042309 RepID=UPI0027828A58|nr:AraC family transcriptional regulator [Variovorax sp. W1I1]MDQ0608208.1 AraC-like DNA-binding protein/mannose-6-phosphate isomerase-like protein (cupin superfamily) [Variovorax sp. W1I1]
MHEMSAHNGMGARAARAHGAASYDALVEAWTFEPILHFQVRLGSEFAVGIESRRRTPLYVFAGQHCQFQMRDGSAPVQVEHGDVLFLPRGGAHRVFDTADLTPLSFPLVIARQSARQGRTYAVDLEASADGAGPVNPDASTMVSGSFFYSELLQAAPLLARLPDVVHLRRRGHALPWLAPMADLLHWLCSVPHGGRGVGMTEAVNALIRHIVLQELRHDVPAAPGARAWGASGPVETKSAAARRDARLLPALHAIHTQPEQQWTMESLARLCHMARTTFATRFRQETGLAPMGYLAHWRVQAAARLLREQRLSLDEVAGRVGYSTGAILARAYKRVMGASPRGHAQLQRAD